MTTPAHTQTRGPSRGYMVNGEWHIGVTSLIKATLADANALNRWKQKKLANHVLDVRAQLESSIIDRDYVIEQALEANKASGPEAELGTQVHKTIEDYETNQEITLTDKKVLGHLDQWVRLKDDHDLLVLSTEITLVNPQFKYAGTADQVVFTDLAPFRKDRFILDLKTGKGVYDTYALQLALLSRCTHWLTGDGELRPISMERRPNTDIALIAKLGPRSGHLHRVDIHKAWKYARHLLDLYAFQQGDGAALISASLPGKAAKADRRERNARRMALLERARTLDVTVAQQLKRQWPQDYPKLTDPTLEWTHDTLDAVDELIANAERGAVA